jgi:hypothetical protein
MKYEFRTRALLGTTVKIESQETELEVFDFAGVRVVIKAAEPNTLLTDSRSVVIRGTGFDTAEDASHAGEQWRDHIIVAFACLSIGADFRERRPTGYMTEDFRAKLNEQNPDAQIYNEPPGILVYPSEPPAFFFDASAAMVVGKQGAQVIAAVHAAYEKSAGLNDRLRLAYDLYSASFSQPAADARFIMLSMALETIIEQRDRPADVQHQVETLIRVVQESSLDPSSMSSLVGGLRALKQESVGQAGRRLAQRLGDRTYLGRAPAVSFKYCYTIRSQLVHGSYPRPTRDEVDLAAANLETFVGHLLGLDILDDFYSLKE